MRGENGNDTNYWILPSPFRCVLPGPTFRPAHYAHAPLLLLRHVLPGPTKRGYEQTQKQPLPFTLCLAVSL